MLTQIKELSQKQISDTEKLCQFRQGVRDNGVAALKDKLHDIHTASGHYFPTDQQDIYNYYRLKYPVPACKGSSATDIGTYKRQMV